MPFSPTTFVNNQPPAISAGQLNKLGTQYDQAIADILAQKGIANGFAAINSAGNVINAAGTEILPGGGGGGGTGSTGPFVSTKSVSALQALSGTNTDATSRLQALCDANEYVIIEGDFLICTSKDLELDDYGKAARTGTGVDRSKLIKQLTLGAGSKLRYGGPYSIRRRGGWKFNEQIAGSMVIPERTKEFTALTLKGDTTPSKYNVGDWIYICSNDPQTNLTGSNYYGSIRQVASVGANGRVVLNAELNRTFTKGRNNYATVRIAETTNILKVNYNDAETLTVGTVVNVWGPDHTLLASNRTVTAMNTSPASSATVTISGSSVGVTVGSYIVKSDTTDGHVGAPFTVLMDMLPPFRLHLEANAEIVGRGYRDPADDGTLGASGDMILFENCLDTWITGPGRIGDNPRQATQFSSCIGGGVGPETNIWKVFNTGSSGYLVNISGGCVGTRILANSLTYGRHGITSNVGGDMYLSFPSMGSAYQSGFIQRDGSSATTVKMGGIGEPEFCIYDPREVAYCTAHAMDTHRSGYGIVYFVNNIHDNAGGINIRADACRVFGQGTIRGGYDRSVFAVSEEVFIAPYIDGVKVSGLRGSGTDFGLFKFAAPFYAINCVAEYSDAPQGTAVFFDERATGDLINMKINNVDEAFRSRSGNVIRVIEPSIGSEVSTIFTRLDAALTTGINTLVSGGDILPIVPDGGTSGVWYYSTDNGTSSAADGLMNDGQQYATPFTGRRGWFHSLTIGVTTAGASGSTAELAVFSSDPFGRITDNKVFSGTVAVDVIGNRTYTLPSRIPMVEGARYHAATLATGGSPQVRRLALGMGGPATDAATAIQQPGLQATKTGATGSFLTWGSNVSYNSTAIKVVVGMSAKSSG